MGRIVGFIMGVLLGVIATMLAIKTPPASSVWLTIDRLEPAMLSGAVALFVVWLTRRRELQKVSMDFYKEFYSKEVAESRYEAEAFFDSHAGTAWNVTDPYEVTNEGDRRKGYAAVTRYWARLGVIYRERELDRSLTNKLMAHTAGYWWGAVYEQMTQRANMYTRQDIIDLCRSIRNSYGQQQFEVGYNAGIKRHLESSYRLNRIGGGSPSTDDRTE